MVLQSRKWDNTEDLGDELVVLSDGRGNASQAIGEVTSDLRNVP
jgi:ABC-type molybdate transport system ATPase subunit